MKQEHLYVTVTTARYSTPQKVHISILLRTLLEILWDKLWAHNQNPRLGVQYHKGRAKSPRIRQWFRECVA
jgi:hypothetical protein